MKSPDRQKISQKQLRLPSTSKKYLYIGYYEISIQSRELYLKKIPNLGRMKRKSENLEDNNQDLITEDDMRMNTYKF